MQGTQVFFRKKPVETGGLAKKSQRSGAAAPCSAGGYGLTPVFSALPADRPAETPPDSYIRKQTLSTGERYITEELKELESTILTAKDRIVALEYDLFVALRQFVAG